MIKFKKHQQKITIPRGIVGIELGKTEALVLLSKNGIWAVHHPVCGDKTGFHLTHVPSGYNVNASGYFKTMAAAQQAAGQLNPLCDWKKIDPTKITNKFAKQCGKILKPYFKLPPTTGNTTGEKEE